jgi:hypothetical protein
MRNLLILAAVLTGSVFAGNIVAPQDEARDIVAKAVDAHGGKELLNKYPAAKIKAKGAMSPNAAPVPFEVLHSFQAPDKVRLVQTFPTAAPLAGEPAGASPLPAKTHSKIILQVGDKIRLFINQQEVVPISRTQAASLANALHVQNISRLVALLDATFCTLILADEPKVGDRPTQGVRVIVSGKKDIVLYFDKETHRLVRAAYTGHDAVGQLGPIQEIYMNYKDVKGVMYPSKTQILMRGQLYCEYEVQEFVPLEKIDPSEFENP